MKRLTGPGPNPSGFCMCGCGGRTARHKQSRLDRGYRKGDYACWVKGHRHLPNGPEYIEDGNGCWIWQRSMTTTGYGRVWVAEAKRHVNAHRVVYERERGPIPEGMSLDHLCRVPRCVNPDHLEPVTHAENCRRGAAAKLTPVEAEAIRSSVETNAVLAARYGVQPGAISAIRNGHRWAA